ncbi:MAG: hypothetical protein AB1461_19880 [Thermodesulfobacteriota bacterium]
MTGIGLSPFFLSVCGILSVQNAGTLNLLNIFSYLARNRPAQILRAISDLAWSHVAVAATGFTGTEQNIDISRSLILSGAVLNAGADGP